MVISIKLIFDGILRGAQQMGAFMISTMSDLVLRVALAWIFSGIWGITGVWLAWPVGWIVGAIIAVLLYQRWHLQHPQLDIA